MQDQIPDFLVDMTNLGGVKFPSVQMKVQSTLGMPWFAEFNYFNFDFELWMGGFPSVRFQSS